MTHPTRRLRALTLSLIITALSVLVLGAASAQAMWWVNGVLQTSTFFSALLVLNGTFLITANINGVPTLVLCDRNLIHNGLFFTNLTHTGQNLFDTNCRTLLNGAVSAPCKPAEPISYKFKGAIFLHEKATYLRIEPETGETLFTINLGEECAIGETLVVKGKVVYKAPTFEKEEVTQFFYPLATGLFADELKAGKSKVTLESEKGFGLQLGGSNEGLPWKGVA